MFICCTCVCLCNIVVMCVQIAVAGDVAALNPASLHHYAIGPLIASEDFKWHVRSKRKDGTVPREEAESAINHFRKDKKIHIQLNTDNVLAINECLDICFKVEVHVSSSLAS